MRDPIAPLTLEEVDKYTSKAPLFARTPKGTMVAIKTSTGELTGIIDTHPGFQPDKWISSWYSGPWSSKGMMEFTLDDLDLTYIRKFDRDLNLV